MDIAEHIKYLTLEGQLLADAAEQAGPDAEVPTCPGWHVRDLLRHTGMVHRWATAFVAEGHTAFRAGAGSPTWTANRCWRGSARATAPSSRR